jgi:hypothetical protein
LLVDGDQKHQAYLYAGSLFNIIVSEYFTIRQANVYGLTSSDPKNKPEDQASVFSSAYFKEANVCKKDDPLYSDKVCKYMTQYIKNAAKTMAKLNILSSQKLFESYKLKTDDKQIPDVSTTFCTTSSAAYDMLLCGFWGTKNEKTLVPFLNLVNNELLYYTIFVKYF